MVSKLRTVVGFDSSKFRTVDYTSTCAHLISHYHEFAVSQTIDRIVFLLMLQTQNLLNGGDLLILSNLTENELP